MSCQEVILSQLLQTSFIALRSEGFSIQPKIHRLSLPNAEAPISTCGNLSRLLSKGDIERCGSTERTSKGIQLSVAFVAMLLVVKW